MVAFRKKKGVKMSTYAISRLKDMPPIRIPYYPMDESKEWITHFCQCANDGHAKAGTGEVYKVFVVE